MRRGPARLTQGLALGLTRPPEGATIVPRAAFREPPMTASPLFDTVVIVDWSARAAPSPRRPAKDAIWIGVVRDGIPRACVYCRTRAIAGEVVEDLLAGELSAGRRVLIGFDFPFGYPGGFAAAVVGTPSPLKLWDFFADELEDSPRANTRFELAGDRKSVV